MPTTAPPPNRDDSDLAAIFAEVAQRVGRKATGYRHDVPAGGPIAAGYSHGPGGNFSVPGVDMDVFHTTVGNRGILGQLPVRPSTDTNPLYAIMTGVTDESGDEAEDDCADAPIAGLVKSCITTSVFGRYERATSQIELNRLGQTNDRADPMDLTLVGSPIHTSGLFATGPGDPSVPGDLLRNETSRKLWELGVALHRLINQQLWTGNPANNVGNAKQLTSFPQLINTGHVDAITNTSCPSVDSQVYDFNFLNIEDNGPALVAQLSGMLHYVTDLADRTGVQPVRWVLAMRPETWWILTQIWPCSYLTYRCDLSDNDQARIIIDGAEQVRMRDQLRTDQALLIDGRRIEVVLDDGIPELTATNNGNVTEGCFASDIWLIPMSVVGGRAVTFLEHMDYSNPSLQSALTSFAPDIRVEGPWITWPKRTNLCLQLQTKIEPRLLMRTPWLAGRLQNVMYCPETPHTRQPFPDDPYNIDGGITERVGPSYYSLWQT